MEYTPKSSSKKQKEEHNKKKLMTYPSSSKGERELGGRLPAVYGSSSGYGEGKRDKINLLIEKYNQSESVEERKKLLASISQLATIWGEKYEGKHRFGSERKAKKYTMIDSLKTEIKEELKYLNNSEIPTRKNSLSKLPIEKEIEPKKEQQRITTVSVGNKVYTNDDSKNEELFSALNELIQNCYDDIWFNSDNEMVAWIRSGGEGEGIGVWDGKWMNFTGKGPIVFGEHHNQLRNDFIKALHIENYLIEGAAERSLFGFDDDQIPQNHQNTEVHQKYSGNQKGKALENYWTRSALEMENFWRDLEPELKNLDLENEISFMPKFERAPDLKELIRTIKGIKVNVNPKEGLEKDINETIIEAQKASDYEDLEKLLDVLGNTESRYPGIASLEVLKKINKEGGMQKLQHSFSTLKKCINTIGYLQFKANASEDEIHSDSLTRDSDVAHTVWSSRREVMMKKNIKEALTKSPKPLLIIMGKAHAENQYNALESIVKQHGGQLVKGEDILSLTKVGAQRL